MATDEIKKTFANLKKLYLDPNNYRIIHEMDYVEIPEEKLTDKSVQKRTFHLIAGDKKQNIEDLVESFKSNGYLPVDQIQVRPLKDENFLVVEGNRRIATLKHLKQEYEEKAIDLGRLNPAIFSRVPVILYTDSNPVDHLTLMALKHISGNKKWGEWNQAKLLEKLYFEHKMPEEEICKRAGIKIMELRRSLRALSFLQQYLESDYKDQFTEKQYPLFREAIKLTDLKEWLGWDEDRRKSDNAANRELFFSWISQEPKNDEEEEGTVGLAGEYLEPVIIKRDDIRLLNKIIKDPKALSHLEKTRDINAAYRSGDQIFYERQQSMIASVNNEIDTLAQMMIQEKYLPDVENALVHLQRIVDKAKASGLSGVEQKTPFHDRIDSHFANFHITEYKKLRNIAVKRLSRINLFAGINNSGKTSLLEAVYLLCCQNDFSGLLEVVRRRGKVAKDRINPEWFLEQLPTQIEAKGIFDQQETSVQIRHYKEENSEIDRAQYIESVEIASSFRAIQQESLTRIFKGRNRETQAEGYKILCPTVFSSPFFLNEPHRYTLYFAKSIQSKSKQEIVNFIRKHVVPTIENIELADQWQRFLVTDSSYAHALDLTEYGEGLQRIFFISLLFASAQNGVILIDEFENAIHTDMICHFTRFICELAEIFNTQVFITSHSKECIDAFVMNIPRIEELSACALVADGDKILAREFAGPEFRKLVEAGNVDLRRAR